MFSRARILGFLSALAMAVSTLVVASPATAHADTNFHALTLLRGWTNGPFGAGPAQAKVVSGIVSFRGAIATTGTNPKPFKVPTNMRPTANVFVKVGLCDVDNGDLEIQPSGVVTVTAETTFAEAKCMTSLDGVSYALTAPTPLPLKNGWVPGGLGGSDTAAAVISGIVHLKGTMSTAGSSTNPFRLPAGMRPSATVYVGVDLCNAKNGRLQINPDGEAFIEPQGTFATAACTTSLDGVSFVLTASATVTLKNGWTNAPFGTSNVARKVVSNTVYLKGAMAGGTSANAFRLPAADRPAHAVYVAADLCNSVSGHVQIEPSGEVFVAGENGLEDAQCFTSLDGVSYAP